MTGSIRAGSLAAAVLLLSACATGMTSPRSLFAAGSARLEPGLWAALGDGCAAPQDDAIQRWPGCATPIWVEPGRLTVVGVRPMRSSYVIATGTPLILERHAEGSGFGAPMDESGPVPPQPDKWDFWVLEMDGAPPFRRGLVWNVRCPPRPEQRLDDTCDADDAAAVRGAARAGQGRNERRRVVWIASLR